MINKNDLRKAISSIAISNAKRNTIYKAFSDLDSITKEEFDSVKSDISKVVESMLTKDTVGKVNGVASLDSNGSVPIEQLGNIDTTLFLIVRELPTTDIKTNKIYLVPNQDGQGNNVYIEYLYVENVWEKLGEFKPEVDLSEYVKSNEIYQCIKKDYDSSKRGANCIAIDDSAQAIGDSAIAIGNNAQATGDGSIAIGGQTTATGFASIALGAFAITSAVSKYALGGFDENKQDIFNIEEITFSQYGNKKYLIGLGGYDGTNLTINNEAGEEVLNPNIKSVQEIINEKADLVGGKLKAEQLPKLVNITTSSTAEEVVTKFNSLIADLKAKGYMEADTAK